MFTKGRTHISTTTKLQRWRIPAWAATAAGLIALGIGTLSAGPAAASPTSNLVFSVDGGTTWSANVNAAPGQTVYAREYYDNDTSAIINGASVTTALPSGFSLVAGSTKVCLNPGTTDPTNPTNELACNTDTGQGGAINESAVWSGQNMAISPTAGLLTQSTSATSGILQVGEFKYLNLDQCAYFGTAAQSFTYAVPTTPNSPRWSAGTTASNTAQSSPTCGPGSSAWASQAVNSAVDNIPLLGHRYLNLDQCNEIQTGNEITYIVPSTGNPGFSAATAASNSTPSGPTCTAGAGYTAQAVNSGIANLDLLGNSYVNLDQCAYYNGLPLTYYVPTTPNTPPWSANTTASTTPQTAQTCGAGNSAFPYQPANSGFAAINIIDPTRGQGFVQWQMTAPSPATTTTYPEDGQLTGPGTGDPSTSGTITVNASVGTPLADPWVIGGGVALLGVAGATYVIVRRRRTTESGI
jgi:hypothetical protein